MIAPMTSFAPRPSRIRPLAPTHALDHALDSLARGDHDATLRCAIPALADEGSGAAAADIVGRALAAVGRSPLAVQAYELALVLLMNHGLVPHAVAAALALCAATGRDTPLETVARQFGNDAPKGSAAPPPLKSDTVEALAPSIGRDELIARADAALKAVVRPKKIAPHSGNLPLWSALPTAAFVRFAKALEVRAVAPGEVLLREGERGDGAIIVARGEVRVARAGSVEGEDETELAVLGAGAIVGEMALVTDAPRAATVTATRGGLVLVAPRAALDEAARDVPAVGDQVLAFCHKRLVDNVMRTSFILREIPTHEREGLSQLFATRTFEAGNALLAQGEPTGGLHLIAAGSVDVRRQDETGEMLRIATLSAGSCVGEIGLVLRRPATASVVATTPVVSLELSADRFLPMVKDRPTLLSRLYDLAVRRDDETLNVIAQEAEEIDDSVLV